MIFFSNETCLSIQAWAVIVSTEKTNKISDSPHFKQFTKLFA